MAMFAKLFTRRMQKIYRNWGRSGAGPDGGKCADPKQEKGR